MSAKVGPEEVKKNAKTMAQRVMGAAQACTAATSKADPTESHPLCTAYGEIEKKTDLAKTLLGVCGFDTDIDSIKRFCASGTVPGIASTSSDSVMSAFDFLSETTKFLTFSGTTGVEFSWDVAESRGSDVSVETEGSFDTGDTYDGSWGFELGRRLTNEYSSSGGPVAGYAYPMGGPVHAVSKKLLEVTPEALKEKRRRLQGLADAAGLVVGGALGAATLAVAGVAAGVQAGAEDDVGKGSGCRRRRLQLGIQGCVSWGRGETEA